MSQTLIDDLVLKVLHIFGSLSGTELASRLGVSFSIIERSLETLKTERLCGISGGGMGPQSYGFRLTEAGHARGASLAEHNQYVGKLPITIADYRSYMTAFHRSAVPQITREAMRQAFRGLVLSDRVMDQLGPAIASRHSLFLYGPPGNGKTIIARTVGSLLEGEIAIPYAIAVDHEIIRVFDPMNHEMVDEPEGEPTLERTVIEDGRWARCRRPVVTVGGELALESLDLGYLSNSGFYRAPLQTLANGGVLIIDDFGRQRSTPGEILNRWIVPLESRVDYLVLQNGQKFEIPFETLVVFATNLSPFDLLDESFLRRIRYKVYADSPTDEDFIRIFELCCKAKSLPFDRTVVESLIADELKPRGIQLRGCQPRDLIDHALSLAAYTEQPATELSSELLSAACTTYFLGDAPLGER